MIELFVYCNRNLWQTHFICRAQIRGLTMGERRRGAIFQIDEQIAALTAKRDEMQKKQREEMGRLCERAGLMDCDIGNSELEAALREVAVRFQRQAHAADDHGTAAGKPRTAAASHGG
jgi:hypothetical protein